MIPPGANDVVSDYIIESITGSSTLGARDLSASTWIGRRAFERVGSLVLPIVVAVGFAVPVGEERVRSVFSQANRSRTSVSDFDWLLDSWTYSEDPISIGEVRMLNNLLALEASEGLVLDLPE